MISDLMLTLIVSKLFQAYRLYNKFKAVYNMIIGERFQSSFELTGYITKQILSIISAIQYVSKLFRAYRLYNALSPQVQRSGSIGFKALSSLQVI